jgi:hypothetical protein
MASVRRDMEGRRSRVVLSEDCDYAKEVQTNSHVADSL